MITKDQMLSLPASERETLYRMVYQMALYSDSGSKLEEAALGSLIEMKTVWGWTEEQCAHFEQKTNRFIAERSKLLPGAGHLSLSEVTPTLQ